MTDMDAKRRLMEEIANEYDAAPLRPDDLTIQDVMNELGCSYTTARSLLDNMVAQGRAVRCLARSSAGHKLWAYRPKPAR